MIRSRYSMIRSLRSPRHPRHWMKLDLLSRWG
jgi:hypothetical protein